MEACLGGLAGGGLAFEGLSWRLGRRRLGIFHKSYWIAVSNHLIELWVDQPTYRVPCHPDCLTLLHYITS